MNESLTQFNKEFLAAKLAQEESEIHMLKQQNSMTIKPNADPFAIDETIDEETDNENEDEEVSNDENFGANNQIRPTSKSNRDELR